MKLFNILLLTTFLLTVQADRFRLYDHPDGGQNPPSYGLRLDGLVGRRTTYSFEGNGAKVLLNVNGNDIRINGKVYGGEDIGSDYSNPELCKINFRYRNNVTQTSDGWKAEFTKNRGHINCPSFGKQKLFASSNQSPSFVLQQDGHRLSDDDTWVGRGWVTTSKDHVSVVSSGSFQDWLFIAEEVLPTRHLNFWRNNLCHIPNLLPFNIGGEKYDSYGHVENLLLRNCKNNPYCELKQQLLVLLINKKAFDLDDFTYELQDIDDYINDGNRLLKNCDEEEEVTRLTEKLYEINRSGKQIHINLDECDEDFCPYTF